MRRILVGIVDELESRVGLPRPDAGDRGVGHQRLRRRRVPNIAACPRENPERLGGRLSILPLPGPLPRRRGARGARGVQRHREEEAAVHRLEVAERPPRARDTERVLRAGRSGEVFAREQLGVGRGRFRVPLEPREERGFHLRARQSRGRVARRRVAPLEEGEPGLGLPHLAQHPDKIHPHRFIERVDPAPDPVGRAPRDRVSCGRRDLGVARGVHHLNRAPQGVAHRAREIRFEVHEQHLLVVADAVGLAQELRREAGLAVSHEGPRKPEPREGAERGARLL